MRYIDKVNYIYDVGLTKTCGYQHCGEKTGFNVRGMFDQSYFTLSALNNILNNVLLKILPFCLFANNGKRYITDYKL